jgi:hypothetical protein
LLPAAARIIPEVVEKAKWVDGPGPFDLATESQRLVPVRLGKDEVVARLHHFGTGGRHNVVERGGGADPNLGHGNRGDERRDARRSRGARHGVFDSGRVQAGAHRVSELAGLSGEPVRADTSDRTIRVLFRPQVEERGGFTNVSNSFGPGSLGRNELFRLEASEDTMRQANRDVRFLGEVLDTPCAVRGEEQRLCCDAGLAREPGGRLRAGPIAPPAPLCLEMEEQARDLDVRVAETVHDGDAVALEDLSRFRCRISRDEQKMALRARPGPLDELPGGGGIGVSLDFDRDGLGLSGEPQKGIALPAALSRLTGFDRDAGDGTQDPEGLRPEATLYFYKITLLHSKGEYSSLVKHPQPCSGTVGVPWLLWGCET